MHTTVLLAYVFVLLIIFFLWPKPFLRVIKWILVLALILLTIAIIMWFWIGNNFFLWPVSFQHAPGFERSIGEDLKVIDSSNEKTDRLILILPGTCGVWKGHRKQHHSQWSRRMLQLIQSGFRVFLMQHRFGWTMDNLKQRVTDVDCVMRWIHEKIPHVKVVILGDGYGATVALKWTSYRYKSSLFPELRSIVCTESRITFSSSIIRLLWPKWTNSTEIDFSEPQSKQDEVDNRYNKDDNLLHLLHRIIGKVPIVFVYARDDVGSDARIWEQILAKYPLKKKDGRPAVFGIRVKNRTLHAYRDLPIMDRHEWWPILNELF